MVTDQRIQQAATGATVTVGASAAADALYLSRNLGGASVKIDAAARAVELATNFTVGDYLDAVAHAPPDQAKIAEGIHRRFLERYLEPGSASPTRHGFTMMAVACLMIEALESFRRGWPDTSQRGAGEQAFCSFFDAHDSFAPFRGHAHEFYKGVRCGILHQAETTLGWRIRRDGELLRIDGPTRTVNAKKFVTALKHALDSYRDRLKAGTWDDELWKSLRVKMERVCANCVSKSKGGSPCKCSRSPSAPADLQR